MENDLVKLTVACETLNLQIIITRPADENLKFAIKITRHIIVYAL